MGKKKSVSTKSIKKTLNPQWNETKEFSGTLGEFLSGGDMLCRVFDKDFGSRDDAIGDLTVSLEPLRNTSLSQAAGNELGKTERKMQQVRGRRRA